MRVLFVCLGNICRSPAAESVFTKLAADAGLAARVTVDSAGTSDYHAGERADPRMRQALAARGYPEPSRSRPFDPAVDFDAFDRVVAMDRKNHAFLAAAAPDEGRRAKIRMMGDYGRGARRVAEIPDPYFGDDAGFQLVIDLLEDACQGLLEEVGFSLTRDAPGPRPIPRSDP